MRKNQAAQHRNHERVGSVLEKLVDPELKSAVQRELRAKHFVLREDQEKNSHRDAQEGQRSGICEL